MSRKAKDGVKPKLRFLEFRNNGFWNIMQLGVAIISESSTIALNKTELVNNGYPIYGADGIAGYIENYAQDVDYIAIVKDGSGVGRLSLYKKYSSVLSTLAYLKSKDISSYNLNYLFYLLQTVRLSSYVKGVGIPHIYYSDFASALIAVPQFLEQQKIADCLSSLDELITAENQKLEALKTHKNGLLQQLFPAEGETVPKLRFSEFQYSGAWEENTFGGTATFINGKAYKQEDLLENGKYRVLRVGNFFTNNEWYYSNLELDEDKYCDYGDLLYAWSASFGPRIWKGTKTIYHYHIWKVVEKMGINKNFLFILLDYETERIKSKQANGLGLLHITKGSIEGWRCLIPESEHEQQKIADCLACLDEKITAQTDRTKKLKMHKEGLMQQLFPSSNDIES